MDVRRAAGMKRGRGGNVGPCGHPTGTQRPFLPGRCAQEGLHHGSFGTQRGRDGEAPTRRSLSRLMGCDLWVVTRSPRSPAALRAQLRWRPEARSPGQEALGLAAKGLFQPLASGPRKPVGSDCSGRTGGLGLGFGGDTPLT